MESWSFWVHYLGILLNLWLSVMLVWRTLDRSFLVMVSTANPCVLSCQLVYCFETILLEYNTILQCRWNTWPSWQLRFHGGTLLLFCQSSSTLVWGLITAASGSLSTCLSSTSTLLWDLITAAGRSLSTCFFFYHHSISNVVAKCRLDAPDQSSSLYNAVLPKRIKYQVSWLLNDSTREGF